METPPREIHTLQQEQQQQQQQQQQLEQQQQWPGRRTRSALAEIPVRIDLLTMQETTPTTNEERTPRHTITGGEGTPRTPWFINVNVNVPASYVSPSPSPDELVIQQRGRRRVPATWSPDVDAVKQQRTPVKGSPNKGAGGGIVLRSTPRKRLLLDASSRDLFGTPEKIRKMSPNSKKNRLDRFAGALSGPLDLALQALTSQQLGTLVRQLMEKHPGLEQDIKDLMPAPDMKPLEERLSDLKKNIFKSLPNSRLTSKTDSPAYSRAATHLLAFKKCLVEQARSLASSQNWGALLDYVFMAWVYVRATPLWDNPPHNACRRSCFKSLAAHCLNALKRGGPWTQKQHELIQYKLEGMLADSEDIQTCLKHVTALK